MSIGILLRVVFLLGLTWVPLAKSAIAQNESGETDPAINTSGLVATINRPGVRSSLAKELFMEVYSPISDVLISGPDSIRSFGCSYISWWLPRHASISQHEGVGIILRQEYKSGTHGETYLCVLSQALH